MAKLTIPPHPLYSSLFNPKRAFWAMNEREQTDVLKCMTVMHPCPLPNFAPLGSNKLHCFSEYITDDQLQCITWHGANSIHRTNG